VLAACDGCRRRLVDLTRAYVCAYAFFLPTAGAATVPHVHCCIESAQELTQAYVQAQARTFYADTDGLTLVDSRADDFPEKATLRDEPESS